MKVLQELLGETPVSTFLESSLTHAPISMPDRAKPFADHLDRDVVRAVSEDGRAILRIIREGRTLLDDAMGSSTPQRRCGSSAFAAGPKAAERRGESGPPRHAVRRTRGARPEGFLVPGAPLEWNGAPTPG